jgi:hypothetical protein
MYTHQEKTIPYHSFFDLQRAAIIRDSPSVRLRKAAKGIIPYYECTMRFTGAFFFFFMDRGKHCSG